MKRVGKGFSNTVTPLFSTMMGVTHSHGEGSKSQPQSRTTSNDSQPTPTTSNIPQSQVHQAQSTPLKTCKRKKTKRVPSSLVSTPPQPESPLVEHSSQENIQKEPIGLSPKSQKVVHEEECDHLERAYTTVETHSVQQDSIKSAKTQSKATSGEKSLKGPGCKKPWGKVMLLLGRRHLLNLPMIHQRW